MCDLASITCPAHTCSLTILAWRLVSTVLPRNGLEAVAMLVCFSTTSIQWRAQWRPPLWDLFLTRYTSIVTQLDVKVRNKISVYIHAGHQSQSSEINQHYPHIIWLQLAGRLYHIEKVAIFTDETCSQVRHEQSKSRRTFLSVTAAVCSLKVIIQKGMLFLSLSIYMG